MPFRGDFWWFLYLWVLSIPVQSSNRRPKLVVFGSANLDTFLHISRLPTPGENLVADRVLNNVPGGKGLTQAVAASKLLDNGVTFVGQLGHDGGSILELLRDGPLDSRYCQTHNDLATGRGFVFLSASGQVSAVLSGGANMEGWKKSEPLRLETILQGGAQCVMLQREIPEWVNEKVAEYCQKNEIVVFQDVGGDDRPISRSMLQNCDFVMPNESELKRLVASFGISTNDKTVVELAKALQDQGANHVLVTQGRRGSTFVGKDETVLFRPAVAVENVVDETGAGDCYRAAFCCRYLETRDIPASMQWASAAGGWSVQVEGAVPSTPNARQLQQQLHKLLAEQSVLDIPRGNGMETVDSFPFLIGSRLNSMKDRPELWQGNLETPRDFVQRQAQIKGLTCVDFNYPQHFLTWSTQEAKAALDEAGLVAGAVCLRYPIEFARGALNHPDPVMRQKALELTKQAAQVALDLGCNEVVIWSAYDGYDYPFQVDYDSKWQELVQAFRDCCDAYPNVKWSLEYKPTDENTRFFTVPSTGAALLMVKDVNRDNFGLTLDVGHMLMSGENPAQSIAMVGRRLFGIQLNDGYTRLAAEDGLMFGSIHKSMALEIMYYLRRIEFQGHLYFDTFPQRTDPIREAEYNIRVVHAYWRASQRLSVAKDDDAVAALEMVDRALANVPVDSLQESK